MKQLVIISGKGGTGKTITTASFAALATDKIVCDCDVDAADLHLLLHPRIKETHKFMGGEKATINKEICTECGECIKACRFDAIGEDYIVDDISCEGCSVCFHVCPVDAINMERTVSGEWFVSKTDYGTMVHAKLGIAEENSGKLVSVVKDAAKRIGEEEKSRWLLVDGPPGIGCPVIAALSGVDAAIVVTEPSLSGIHDLERVNSVAVHFGIKTLCVVNKYDINYENSEQIEKWCERNGIPVLGKIPFDDDITEALIRGKTVVEYSQNAAAQAIRDIWGRVENLLGDG
jgi:MinD superfamily P-loop ATPase